MGFHRHGETPLDRWKVKENPKMDEMAISGADLLELPTI